jgi:hypothetical protein
MGKKVEQIDGKTLTLTHEQLLMVDSVTYQIRDLVDDLAFQLADSERKIGQKEVKKWKDLARFLLAMVDPHKLPHPSTKEAVKIINLIAELNEKEDKEI